MDHLDHHNSKTHGWPDNYYEQYPSFSFINNRHNVQPTINSTYAPQDSYTKYSKYSKYFCTA